MAATIGVHRDNGKENGTLLQGYVGIIPMKMEATI